MVVLLLLLVLMVVMMPAPSVVVMVMMVLALWRGTVLHDATGMSFLSSERPQRTRALGKALPACGGWCQHARLPTS